MNASVIGKRTAAAALFAALWISFAPCGHGLIVSTPDELMKLDDEQFLQNVLFFSTTANEKTPPADFWRVMDRLRQLPLTPRDEISHGMQMGYLAQAISRFGTRGDFERLLAISDKLPAEGWSRRKVLDALLTAACRLEVEALRTNREPIKIQLPNQSALLTAAHPGQSPELLNAERLGRRIAALNPVEPAWPRTNGWIGVSSGWSFFYDAISDVLHGRVTNGSQRLAQFQWGSWCGTGMDSFAVPHDRALFVAYLQERNYGAALAKGITLSEDRFSISPSLDDDGAWQREIITRCGFDWETIYAGLPGSPYGGSAKLDALARFGSEKAGRLLLDMAAEKSISDRGDYLRALAGAIGATDLLTRTNGSGTTTLTISSSGLRHFGRAPSNTFSAALKMQLLGVLEAKLQPGASVETATLVCQLLSELGRRESAPALQRAMALPYAKVREIAARALENMGETVPPMARLDPVVFRLLANGRPLTNEPVDCEVRMAGGRATSRGDVTDGEGLLRLEHDWFSDTRYTVTNVVFIPRRWPATNPTWFELQTPSPTNLATVTDLRVTLAPVRVAIRTSAPEEFYRGEQMSISLRVERDRGYGRHFDGTSSAALRVPFTNQLVFPALQPGRYELQLTLPGAARWAQEFVVTERGAMVEAVLSRGADLRYEITTPGARSQFVAPQFEILRAGKVVQHYLHYDGSPDAWHSLPAGEYTFRVLSSDEATRQRRAANEIIPQPRGYRGAEVPFRITETSPKLIDLGVIALRPKD